MPNDLTLVAIVDERLGNSTYLLDLGKSRALWYSTPSGRPRPRIYWTGTSPRRRRTASEWRI